MKRICAVLVLSVGGFILTLLGRSPECAGSPTVLDFEAIPGFTDGMSFTSIPGLNGITFQNIIYVKPGNPRVAFNGDSAGGPGGIDDANTGASISVPSGNGSIGIIRSINQLADISLQALDIEAAGTGNEFLTVSLFDDQNAGAQLGTFTLNAGDPGTGDGLAAQIAFPGITGVHRIEFFGLNTGTDTAGYAVDNVTFTIVPEPASFILLALASAGLLLCCRR